jgi:acyl carrier protein
MVRRNVPAAARPFAACLETPPMTTTTPILARLTDLLRDILDDDDVTLTPETSARDVPGWDSLANVRFMLAIEGEFGLRLAAAEVARLDNVGDLVALIDARA